MATTTDWLTSFLQQNGYMLDKSGNIVTAPSSGMVKAQSGMMSGAPAAATGGVGSPAGIDPSRLWSNATGLDPNAPPIFTTQQLTYNKGATGNQSGPNYGAPGQQTFQSPGWSAPGMDRFSGSNMEFGGTADAPTFTIKNSGGTGMAYKYSQDPTGQYWLPSQQAQVTPMSTNFDWTPAVAMAATALGAGALGGYGAAADAGAGTTAATAAPAAGDAAAGAGAAAAPAYGGVGSSAAAGGGGIGSQAGYAAGTDSLFGTGGGAAALSPGTAAQGALSNAGNGVTQGTGTSLWQSLTGSGGSGSGGSGSSILSSLLGSNGTGSPSLLGALAGAIGGSLGQNAIVGNDARAAQQASGAYAGQSAALANLANQVRANGQFTPVGYTNASGSTTFDPKTNSWVSSLSPQSQQQSDMWNTLGQQSLQRNQNLDPNALAAQYQSQVQSLLAPQRQQALDSTIGTLAAKGLLGQGVNTTGAGAVNPLLASLSAGNAAQDTQVAMAAQQYGQTAQNNGLTQLSGIFGQLNGVNSNAAATFNPALQSTQQQINNTNTNNSMWSNLNQGAIGAATNAAMPNANLLAAQNGRDAGNYGMWTNLLKGLLGGS